MTVNINMSFNIPSSDGGSTVAAKPRESGESGSFAALMNRSLKAEPDAGRRMKPSAGTQDDFAFASMNTQSPRQETTVSSSTPSDPSSGSSQMSDRDPSEQVQVLSEDRQDAAIAVIEDVSEGIKENLIDELDIDEEELTEVMETLGLAYMDLLNPQVLEEVITSVEEAIPELEPDAAVTDIVAELIPQNEELLQESLSENGVSMEEFAAFLDQVEEGEIELPGELEALLPQTEPEANNPILKELSTMQDQAPVLQNSNPEATAGEPVVSVTERVTVIKISDEEFGEPEISITETRTVAVPEEVQEIEDAVLPEAVQDLEPGALGEEITTAEPQGEDELQDPAVITVGRSLGEEGSQATSDGGEGFDFENNDSGQNPELEGSVRTNMPGEAGMNTGAFAQQDVTSFAEALSEANAAVERYSDAQTQDIMNQIVSRAATTITDTVSRMEMELNPQNLGRMIMQVQQQEGVVTARLIAQNESVRAALENQLVALRESLEAKGIKVNAVEVSVGTHEFERNLEEGQQNPFEGRGEQNEQRESGRSRVRSINRGDLENDAIELSEEEELAARIMQDNGGTVDYTA